MGLPVIQETDENSILFPTRNNQSNAIWRDQMDLDDVMALIESQTHTEGKTFLDFILCDKATSKSIIVCASIFWARFWTKNLFPEMFLFLKEPGEIISNCRI